MAYGDLPLDAPFKPNKGLEGGACNRQSCQAEPANYYNHGSHAWYCWDCANSIGNDVVNHLNWMSNHYPQCQHPMFEDRQMITNREVGLFLLGHDVSPETMAALKDARESITLPEFGLPTGRTGGLASQVIWDDPYREEFPKFLDVDFSTVEDHVIVDLKTRSLVDPLSKNYYASKDSDGREEQRALFGIGVPARRQGKTLAGRNLAAQICINGAPKPEATFTSERPLSRRAKRRAKGKR